MIIKKNIGLHRLIKITFRHTISLIILMGLIAFLYHKKIINFSIPWLPVSVIGTAVSFYIGFKNNQSYDRMWEARKIWGGIVNESRTWGMMIDGFISNLNTKSRLPSKEIHSIKRRLIYRHIAWLYAHRKQLLIPTQWERTDKKGITATIAKRYQNKDGLENIDFEFTTKLLEDKEYDRLIKKANSATQIINEQSRDLSQLREQDLIDDFRHMELSNILSKFYTLQGKNERIKKFPLPRQYSNMSKYFVYIFIFLLPFSMMPELLKLNEWGIWLSVPIVVLISWVFLMMELVGDYSENPFQGMVNDIPMLSLCRTIEIDLREILNETELPPNIEAEKGVLI
ncbi:bestrophin family protein [Maribacter sp. 1_MG-2023]|uniref:bestrophin family protein n=1 Tax=Maribacter sp. 1_MG-2023 TaxID=3062677 RepID=UPI0026E20384|nr:bestrophin family ion channel [Maribacter sp. 1_MG-2023]MDO6470927.1 bestrophin family ion channel [Maribacter sp. 1_MG-2023]